MIPLGAGVAAGGSLGAPVAKASAAQTSPDTADAYIYSKHPSSNFGKSTTLRDQSGSSTQDTYLTFNVGSLTGSVTRATLRLYPTTNSASGFEVRSTSTGWGETKITWNNAPAASSTVTALSGPLASGQWVTLDVTSLVKGSGLVSFALTPANGSTSLTLSSRESGSSVAPQLIVETDPGGGGGGGGGDTAPVLPYDAASAWNTPVGSSPKLDALSSVYINAIADNALQLTSDPSQYTIPVWVFDSSTPTYTVNLSGYYSTYDAGDNSRVGHGFAPTITGIPVPAGAVPGTGSDGQIIFWDPSSGTEYGFWQWGQDGNGNYFATNGYRYHTTAGYYGRFADGLAGRGDGTPYLAGLVRKWEIDQGHIDHALAFAYNSPSSAYVYPASKSDGGNFGGILGTDLPEGSRLQLDPSLTDAQLAALGLSPTAITVAHALQKYGAYVVDHSGSSKIYVEAGASAGWDSSVNRTMLSGIPWSDFRVVDSF
jgi:hypothetical protein